MDAFSIISKEYQLLYSKRISLVSYSHFQSNPPHNPRGIGPPAPNNDIGRRAPAPNIARKRFSPCRLGTYVILIYIEFAGRRRNRVLLRKKKLRSLNVNTTTARTDNDPSVNRARDVPTDSRLPPRPVSAPWAENGSTLHRGSP
ncbi:hypothetical protein EVAR_78156_1 [Eumeta japonica]|uniref:Uncharacterized protein n=1 Tax=Eumeta variegata TaxID=151549 RepID=A0A4C1UZY6_EUMVA|nr:hypothetical protein EVAR_78156_1 [Eumeta japonica]